MDARCAYSAVLIVQGFSTAGRTFDLSSYLPPDVLDEARKELRFSSKRGIQRSLARLVAEMAELEEMVADG